MYETRSKNFLWGYSHGGFGRRQKQSPGVPRMKVISRTLRANFQASGREGIRHPAITGEA
jgi:hypothetical protein